MTTGDLDRIAEEMIRGRWRHPVVHRRARAASLRTATRCASRSTTRSSTACPARGESATARSCRSMPARSSTAGTATRHARSSSARCRRASRTWSRRPSAPCTPALPRPCPATTCQTSRRAIEDIAARARLRRHPRLRRPRHRHGDARGAAGAPTTAPARKGRRIEPGLCLAIEPMFTLGTHNVRIRDDGWTVVTADGTLAAHWEHTIAVLPDGPRILTRHDGGSQRRRRLTARAPGSKGGRGCRDVFTALARQSLSQPLRRSQPAVLTSLE